MTNKTKMRGLLWALFGACLALAPTVRAESLEDSEVRRGNPAWAVLKSSGTSFSKAVNLYYVGSATEAVVTITSATMIFYAPFGTADTSVDTDGVIDLTASAYDTIGELCKYLDGLSGYRCEMLGAKTDDNTNLLKDQTAASLTADIKSSGGLDVFFDSAPVAGGGNVETLNALRVGRQPAPGKRVTLKYCNATVTPGTSMTVYGKQRIYESNSLGPSGDQHVTGAVRDDTTIAWKGIASTQTWHMSGLGGIEFARDAHVVVSADGNSTALLNSHFLDCYFEEK